ncbi:MAG TPA: HAMP domain-containing sensor histidine kinase [Terriglobia bacterium]|nr:HAMP domain-containing sensor histidine kinase [Terriglobia bacterium]
MLKNFDFNGPIIDWLNDYAPQGIVTTDTDLIIRGWNRWLEQSTGRGAEVVVGRPLFEIFPDLVERGLDRMYRSALEGQVTVLAHRFHRYLVKLPARPEYNLPEMQQSARIAPLVSQGRVVGTITAIDDVSERVVHESELVTAREEADKANAAKDRFLAVLSHDLRTPLTSILGWARIFRTQPDEEAIRKGAEVIERNAGVQLQLIEELLDVFRISAAKLQLDLASVDVRETVRSALETLEPTASAKGIRLDRCIPDERRMARLDSKRFQQIIWNLLSNSLKFTPEGGCVSVNLNYTDQCFQLTIADTGKGISPESLPHLFEPLWQAEGSGGHGGLGLGLAIVRNLAELHGGSIRVESSGPGHGSKFIVEIPWLGPQSDQRSPTFQNNSQIM